MKAVFRPMTEREKALALALGGCSFPTASFSKRFARALAAQARERGEITDRQAERLEIQAWIYRRQMPGHLLPDSAPAGYQTPTQRWKAPVGRIVEALKAGKNIQHPTPNTQHPMSAGAPGESGTEADDQQSTLNFLPPR